MSRVKQFERCAEQEAAECERRGKKEYTYYKRIFEKFPSLLLKMAIENGGSLWYS